MVRVGEARSRGAGGDVDHLLLVFHWFKLVGSEDVIGSFSLRWESVVVGCWLSSGDCVVTNAEVVVEGAQFQAPVDLLVCVEGIFYLYIRVL